MVITKSTRDFQFARDTIATIEEPANWCSPYCRISASTGSEAMFSTLLVFCTARGIGRDELTACDVEVAKKACARLARR